MQRSSLFIAPTIALMLAAGIASAQCAGVTRLNTFNKQSLDHLGLSGTLALGTGPQGPMLLTGIPGDNTPQGLNAGSVHVFYKVNGAWTEQQNAFFEGFPLGNEYRFGTSVGLSDPYAIVGAPGAGNGGAVYLFERSFNHWDQKSRVEPSGTQADDDLGRSVAISGNWAIAGAPLHDFDFSPNNGIQQPDAGCAYILRRQNDGTWDSVQQLFEVEQFSTLTANQHLGAAVAMKDDVAVVGAPFGTNVNYPSEHGYIKIYRRNAQNQWVVDGNGRFFSNNAESGDQYGASVATDGTSIAIGAPMDDSTVQHGGSVHTDSGCVYIQRYYDGVWHIDGQLFADDITDSARFGSSVAISGDRVVIGAAGINKTYVFRRTISGQFNVVTWVQESVFDAADPLSYFGSSVAFDGSNILVGAPYENPDNVTDSGSIYAYDRTTQGNDVCSGAIPVLAGNTTGCTDAADRDGFTTCGGSNQGPDVWYAWTPECSGNVIIDTFGSTLDTVLSVHSGCPETGRGGSNSIVCNDDGFGSVGPSLVTFDYVANTTYLIRIAGYNGDHGAYTLRINPIAPSNDSCGMPLGIANGATNFGNCYATSVGTAVQRFTNNATVNIGNDVWFRYTATCAGTVTADTCGSDFDTVIGVYPFGGCPTDATIPIAANDDRGGSAPDCGSSLASFVSFPAVAGDEFLIRVSGYRSAGGSVATGLGVLNMACNSPCPADFNNDGVLNSDDLSDFITGYFNQPSDARTDFNNDGAINSDDLSDFITAYFNGCN